PLVSGSRVFSIALKTAGSATVTASDVTHVGNTPNTSPSITVGVGAFTKLQVLVPGESAAPGTASGKSGTASNQTAGTAFNFTVNAVDANWNLISNDTDAVNISSGACMETLPSNAALVAGTKS